jgi:hypothetical protein
MQFYVKPHKTLKDKDGQSLLGVFSISWYVKSNPCINNHHNLGDNLAISPIKSYQCDLIGLLGKLLKVL